VLLEKNVKTSFRAEARGVGDAFEKTIVMKITSNASLVDIRRLITGAIWCRDARLPVTVQRWKKSGTRLLYSR
jgi:hypothetical protein